MRSPEEGSTRTLLPPPSSTASMEGAVPSEQADSLHQRAPESSCERPADLTKSKVCDQVNTGGLLSGKNNTFSVISPRAASTSSVDQEKATARASSPVELSTSSTLLLEGAREGSSKIVKLALSLGADVSARDEDQRTAFHLAAGAGATEVADLLLKSVGEEQVRLLLEQRDVKGWTPLHVAVCKEFVNIADLFLKCGADLRARLRHNSAPSQGFSESSAIHFAAMKQNQLCLHMLLGHGASLLDEDSASRLPLHYAAARGDPLFIGELVFLEPRSIFRKDQDGMLALHCAAQYSKAAAVSFLAHLEPSLVNARNRFALSPLKLCEITGCAPLRSLLMKVGNQACDGSLKGVADCSGDFQSQMAMSPSNEPTDSFPLSASESATFRSINAVLKEREEEKIKRAIRALGEESCVRLCGKTAEILKTGGLLTTSPGSDVKRLRTAGGVFLHLVKKEVDEGFIDREKWRFITREKALQQRATLLTKRARVRQLWSPNALTVSQPLSSEAAERLLDMTTGSLWTSRFDPENAMAPFLLEVAQEVGRVLAKRIKELLALKAEKRDWDRVKIEVSQYRRELIQSYTQPRNLAGDQWPGLEKSERGGNRALQGEWSHARGRHCGGMGNYDGVTRFFSQGCCRGGTRQLESEDNGWNSGARRRQRVHDKVRSRRGRLRAGREFGSHQRVFHAPYASYEPYGGHQGERAFHGAS